MKRNVICMTSLLVGSLAAAANANELTITGAVDGPLPGGTPKAIEIHVLCDIDDLSIYGVGSANNGGGSDGEEFTFPAIGASAGDYIYVASEEAEFTNFFGFAPDYTSGAMGINGDDAIEVFKNGFVIDVFGDINMDGSGQPWEYLDGWAYRVSNTGPDGDTFVLSNWSFSGVDALDGETSNDTAANPMPIGTYTGSCLGFDDCNDNGIPDDLDIKNGTSLDCNGNGIPDECELNNSDCNENGIPDDCDIANGTSLDCNENGVPDECELVDNDCNENGVPDECDIANGTSLDENGNGTPDECETFSDVELLITELMQNPSAVFDSDGEWFEVHNYGATPIDLLGYVFADDNTESFTVDASVIVAPGGYAVLGNNADFATNGGVNVDYEYGTQMFLSNSSDELNIFEPGGLAIVDRIAWDDGFTFPDPTGASMNLDPSAFDEDLNDLGENWCEGFFPYGDGDLGTPGSANSNCGKFPDCNENGIDDAIDIADGTSNDCNNNAVPDECDIADGTSQDANGNGIPDECEATDDDTLIITEIMQNPFIVGDEIGEWFEVTNISNAPIDMQGMFISDNQASVLIDIPLVVNPGEFVIFARNGDDNINGGIVPDFVWPLDTMALSNGFDNVTVTDTDGTTVIDRVAWDDGNTFPDPSGASMTLNPADFDANLNNSGDVWCEAVSTYGFGDLGTPGGANDSCDGTGQKCPCTADIFPAGEPCPGDGSVDVNDLLSLLAQWGPCSSDCSADIFPDGAPDGSVDVNDLLSLLAQWGQCL